MENSFIYTDICCPEIAEEVKKELGLDLIQRYKNSDWTVANTMFFISSPKLVLAVFNAIDETTVMEVSLLEFMCKPILVTASSIKSYPMVEKTITYIDKDADLRNPKCNFISWYKNILEERWKRKNYHQMRAAHFCG